MANIIPVIPCRFFFWMFAISVRSKKIFFLSRFRLWLSWTVSANQIVNKNNVKSFCWNLHEKEFVTAEKILNERHRQLYFCLKVKLLEMFYILKSITDQKEVMGVTSNYLTHESFESPNHFFSLYLSTSLDKNQAS